MVANMLAGLVGLVVATSAAADPLKCGIGTQNFPDCPQGVETIVKSGILDFWWNWGTIMKLDMAELSPSTATSVQKAFTPMLWGQGKPEDGYAFLRGGNEWVMGYNEPDQYGPWCAGPATKGVVGCTGDGGDYRPATSDGWAPTFDPAKAAPLWQETVNDMTSAPEAQGGTVNKIASPSMALNAAPEDNCAYDPSKPGANVHCNGWLQGFKRATLALHCTGFGGKQTNCWDVISAIPIHCYARTGAECLQKIQKYHDVFAEDFAGTNGRTKKTLWLTEVTAASNEATFITKFVDDLLSPQTGLNNRQLFGFVEKISWFSEWKFPAFQTGPYTPHEGEMWSSALYLPTTGGLTEIGKHFVALCGGTVPTENSTVMI